MADHDHCARQDLKLSLGEGSRIESGRRLKSPVLLSLLTSSSKQLTEEEREEKRRTRETRARKRMEDRKRMSAKANSKVEVLVTAAAENVALKNVADDLAARAIASASQSAALFGALSKIQKLQTNASVKTPITEAPPVLAAPIPRMNPTSFQPLLRQIQLDTETVNRNLEIPAKKAKTTELMTQMPSVKAKGDGPNGREIEGILSQWLNGQVVIVCHCHGSYLTPAEFIEHAGYTDVTNPMQHITVWFPTEAL